MAELGPLQAGEPLQTDWVAFAIILIIIFVFALILSWPALRSPSQEERGAPRTSQPGEAEEE